MLFRSLLDKWKNDSKVKLYNNAVWDKVDKIKIYILTEWSDASTLYLEKNDRKIDKNIFSEIESIDLSDFIKNNFTQEDYIILKLDIEGAEWEVVNDLIETNQLSKINELYVEWHDRFFSHDFDSLRQKLKKYPNLIYKNWEF